jgi:Fe-S cluster assembly protein SufD
MEVKKRVFSKVHETDSPSRQFPFTGEMLRPPSSPFYQEHKQAYDIFQSLPIPSTKEETWRRTDLRSFHPELFSIPVPSHDSIQRKKSIITQNKNFIILENNIPFRLIDREISSGGVIFTDLASAEREYPDLVQKVKGKVISPSEGKFAALSHAFSQNGIFIYVPRDTQLSQPLTGLVRMNGNRLAFISHTMIFLEPGASLDFYLEFESSSISDGQSFHSGLLEMVVSPSARLRITEVQALGDHTWNFIHEKARVEKDASLEWTTTSLGARLSKTFTTLDLTESGAQGRVSGIYLPAGNQHMDHVTRQNHFSPHTSSDLLYKGALLGKSRSVWQGMIYVAPGAIKTDGYQANRNLMLSSNARVDSIPGLEILADDVRCSHGATTGKIDSDQIFYILSRGIPRLEAEKLLVQGFFAQILDKIPSPKFRTKLNQVITKKIQRERD